MGVAGLTPFLQKSHPQIIHKLPNRLKDLAGKRIVIDGTLITQRLHYAPSPHQFRHVLGWYNLAREMNESGVSAVCIFDGQKRSKAKAPETRRREETRRLDQSRGQLEISRAKRLQTLKTLMSGVRSLDEEGKSKIAEILSRLNPSTGTGIVGAMDGLNRVGEQLRALGEEVSSTVLPVKKIPVIEELKTGIHTVEPSSEEVQVPTHEVIKGETPVVDLSSHELFTPIQSQPNQEVHPTEFPGQTAAPSDEKKLPEQPQDSRFMQMNTNPLDLVYTGVNIPVPPIPSVEELRTNLLSSYRDFKSSISRVASFPLPENKLKSVTSTPSPPAAEPEDEDVVLSKRQCELTLEEGRVWDELTLATTPYTPPLPPPLPSPSLPTSELTLPDVSLVSDSAPIPVIPMPSSTPLPPDFVLDQSVLRAAEDRLDALRTRSEVVAESYQRRMDAPTRSTYTESMEILEAMGVLCYEIEGEHEGEALASSLVLKGLADYVVSEDSDVLVYEAPILRNISSRGEPLVLINGHDVREALGLSRGAFIDFALLLGTDFSKRIKNVGPQRAYKFIQDYGSIENIIKSQSKYQPTIAHKEYLAQIKAARAIFSSVTPVPRRLAASMKPTVFGFGVVDQAKVNVIMERCGLGRALMMDAYWDYEAALAGNYFDDSPTSYF